MATVGAVVVGGVGPADGPSSAVSWPAIFAGAAAAAALSLILLVLGTGLGLSAVSPWAARGATATAMSWSAILWVVFAAVASSGLGGYLAGRLRVRWPSVHTDEVYFRDTAHGFLAWAVATLVTAAILTTVIGTILGVGVTAGATAVGGATGGAAAVGGALSTTAHGPASSAITQSLGRDDHPSMYAMDSLFRVPTEGATISQGSPTTSLGTDSGRAQGGGVDEPMRGNKGEAARIFVNSFRTGSLSPEDTRYAGHLVSQATGISQQEAEQRVTAAYAAAQKEFQDAEAKAKQLADQTRKDAAYASLWIFVSLLGGAFFASLMATFGGRQRDLF